MNYFKTIYYKVFKFILCVLFFLGHAGFMYAQSPRFEQVEIIKNINDYDVNCIFQDHTGYIWFGTSEWLFKHDGIYTIKQSFPDSIKSNNITAIGESAEKVLWVGLDNGTMLFLKNNTFETFNPEEGLSKAEISAIYFDSSNTLWFSTHGEGIYCYNGNERKRLYNYNTDDGLADNYTYCFAEDDNHLLYAGTDNGISVISLKEKKVISRLSMKNGLPDNLVKHLVYNDDVLLVGMHDEGICRYVVSEKKFEGLIHLNDELNDFICLDKNDIWVSLKRGISRINTSDPAHVFIQELNTAHGLASNASNTIFSDREKNVWVGAGPGVSKRKSNYFEFLDHVDNIPFQNVFSLVSDRNKNIWVASEAGLFKITNNSSGKSEIKKIFNSESFAFHSFISVHEDTEGFIWAGTYGFGVYKTDPQTLNYKHYNTSNNLCNDNIININDDSLSVWFSSLGGGITILDKKTGEFECINSETGMESNYIYSTYTDNECNIWIASDGGRLSYFDKKKIIFPPVPDSLYSKNIYRIEQDKDKNIWFITDDQGLFKYDGNNIENINEADGLRTNNLNSFIISDYGDIVLVHNQGIDIYDPVNKTFTYFGENFNLANLSPGLNAIHKDRDGNIWIGHKTGLLIFKPEKYHEDKIHPEIHLSGIKLNSEDLYEKRKYFKYFEDRFIFNYVAFWFKAPESLVYRCKLEGHNEEWVENTSRAVNYSDLSPGEYTFKIQVSSNPGRWYGNDEATYHFIIKKPFWETAWFISLVILLLIIGITRYIRSRVDRLEKEKKHLEDEVKKRTHEILMQKEEIEAQRDEIEAQRDEVTKNRDMIALQNENITASIQYASNIQEALLFENEGFNKFSEYFIFNKPRDIVSGDFYFISELSDGSTVLMVADCTGHGVPGAFMSILGMSLLKEILNNFVFIDIKGIKASHIIEMLRDKVKSSLRQKGREGESKDGMDVAFCLIDHKNNKLQFAGAYNPLYIVRNGELIIYKGDRMPIGIQINEKPDFTNHEIILQRNDIIYMFSDGYADQIGGPNDQKFKAGRFKELLCSIAQYPMNEQYQKLEEKYKEWLGNNFQIDDILIVGIKI